MGKDKHNGKARTRTAGFLMLPGDVTSSIRYVNLPPAAVKLLIDIGAQYNGHNNGSLSASFTKMKPRGWASEATLNKAKRLLLDSGFIVETRKGHRPNVCSMFALAWRDLDDPRGFEYDAGARTRFLSMRGIYRDAGAISEADELPDSAYMNAAAVGRMFGIDTRTVYRWVEQGNLPPYRMNGQRAEWRLGDLRAAKARPPPATAAEAGTAAPATTVAEADCPA